MGYSPNQAPLHFASLVLCVILCVAMAGPKAAAQPCGGWQEQVFQNPSPRYSHATAFDSRRGVTVLFGGRGSTSELADTWERDGRQWTHVASQGPTPRHDHAMAYDSRRGVTVLFGGRTSSNNAAGDTWEWNGLQWTRVTFSGPAPRWGHVMVFDEAKGVTVLFGGSRILNSEWMTFGDTWEWNGAAWTLVADSGPLPATDASMAYDSDRQVTVLFGGQNLNGGVWRRVRDTWEWNGSAWSLVATGGPLADAGHAMAYHAAIRASVMHGTGWNYTWMWDGAQWRQATSSGPARRSSFSMCYDSQRERTLLFGGYDLYDDTWEFDGDLWAASPGGTPTQRHSHAMTFDTRRGRAVLMGGYIGLATDGETWEWDGRQWSLITRESPGRYHHAMVYDEARGVVTMFGGEDYDEWLYLMPPHTWTWDGATWTRVATTGPPARTEHVMAYDTRRGVAVLTGGYNGNGALDDTWEWDGQTWNQVASGGIPALTSAAMAYDPRRGVTILFGGESAGGACNGDTWEWDGRRWARVATTGPSPRSAHAMVYDAAHQAIILFGGQDESQHLNDTWIWNGTAWNQMARSTPDPRTWHAMAYDELREEIVMFGGYEAYQHYFRDTWLLRLPEPELTLTSPCPDGGITILQWTCATPLGRVAVVFSFETGHTVVPPGPCSGLQLGLGGDSVRLLTIATSNAYGGGTAIGSTPRQVCGAYLQVVNITTCTPSNVVRFE